MSTIPAVIDQLVTIYKTALPDYRVDDGPTKSPFESTNGTDRGVVAAWQPDGPAVEAEIIQQGAGADNHERYRVYCAIMLSSGDSHTRALREEAFTTLAAVRAQLRQEHPISPGVMKAFVDFVDLDSYPIDGGMQVALRFAVEVDAFDR